MFDPRSATASPRHREVSILFAARPTVRVLRENHLARIPLPGDTETHCGDGST